MRQIVISRKLLRKLTFLDAVIVSQIFMPPRFWVPLSLPVPFFIDIIYLQTAKIIWFLLKDRALVAKKKLLETVKIAKISNNARKERDP